MKKLYINAQIITMENPHIYSQMLVNNNKIEAVADNIKIDADEIIDMQNRCILPAFIDSHSHFSAVATSYLQIDLYETDKTQALEKIRSFTAENQPTQNEFVLAANYDSTDYPIKSQLDSVCPYPMVLTNKSGHAGVFNSAALNCLGIDIKSAKNNLEINFETGYLEESAFISYIKKVPLPSREKLTLAFEKAGNLYVRNGITIAQEGMFTSAMQGLYENNSLPLDINAYIDFAELNNVDINHALPNVTYRGIKIFLDGSPQLKTAFVSKPYENTQITGSSVMTDDMVYQAVLYAAKNKLQILAHANGDMAIEQFICAVEKVSALCPEIATLRPVCIHSQLATHPQLDKMKALRIIPSFFIAHIYHFGDIHIKNLARRAQSISPAGYCNTIGLVHTFHTDSPVIKPDMFETIWVAVQRQTKNKLVLGENERVCVYDALKAVTINAAYSYFIEKTNGSLAPGKFADFIVVDKNPLSIDKDDIKNICVLSTYKNGVKIYG